MNCSFPYFDGEKLLFSFFSKVDDVESKLDNLIELYMQDRKRLLSLPICPETSHSNPNLPPLPPNPPSGAAPILMNSNANYGASSSGSLKVKLLIIPEEPFS